MEEILKRANELIKSISESCVKVAEALQSLTDRAFMCSCKADVKAKDVLFEDFQKAIDGARKSCPDKQKEIDEMQSLLDRARTVKCGGG